MSFRGTVFKLRGIKRRDYERLRSLPENDKVRMTYDRGNFVLMSPSSVHDVIRQLVGRMVDVWSEERNIPMAGRRSMTLRRRGVRRGLESDECFYFQNVSAAPMSEEIEDLATPPDLVVEVEVWHRFRSRLPIYAALGVPEVWHWRKDILTAHHLADGTYACTDASGALPGFPLAAAQRLLLARNDQDETAPIRGFRAFVRSRPDQGA